MEHRAAQPLVNKAGKPDVVVQEYSACDQKQSAGSKKNGISPAAEEMKQREKSIAVTLGASRARHPIRIAFAQGHSRWASGRT